MRNRKKIYVWGPDLRKKPTSPNCHMVEVLAQKPKKGEEIDKNWVKYKLVKVKK